MVCLRHFDRVFKEKSTDTFINLELNVD